MKVYLDNNTHTEPSDYTKEKYAMPEEDAESVYAELGKY